jgi:hypothetical protein
MKKRDVKRAVEIAMDRIYKEQTPYSCVALCFAEVSLHLPASESLMREYEKFYNKGTNQEWGLPHIITRESKNRRLLLLALFGEAYGDVS